MVYQCTKCKVIVHGGRGVSIKQLKERHKCDPAKKEAFEKEKKDRMNPETRKPFSGIKKTDDKVN